MLRMTEKWVRDTGLTFALVSLLLGYRYGPIFLTVAAAFILAVLFVPSILKPLARIWLGITELLGAIMGRIFFGLVYFVVITPVGLVKRLRTIDPRDLELHRDRTSELVDAQGIITKEHLTKPY